MKVKLWDCSTLKKYLVNGEGLEKNLRCKRKKFGVKGEEASKRVSRTGQNIIDLVISDPSITAEAMSVKIGVSKRSVKRVSKSCVIETFSFMKALTRLVIGALL